MKSFLTLCALFTATFLAAETTFELKSIEAPTEQVLAMEAGHNFAMLGSKISAAFATGARIGLPLKGELRLRWHEDTVDILLPFRQTEDATRQQGRLPEEFSIEELPARTEVYAQIAAGTARNKILYDAFRAAVEEAGYTVVGPLIERYPPGSRKGGTSILAVAVATQG